jgi:hypothetical protein
MSLKFIHVPNGKYRLFILFSKVVTAGDQKIKPEKNEKCCIEPFECGGAFCCYCCLTETTGFTFGFQKAKDVVFANRTLDVTDDATVGVVHEFNADLSNTTTGAGTAKNLGNSGELNGLL